MLQFDPGPQHRHGQTRRQNQFRAAPFPTVATAPHDQGTARKHRDQKRRVTKTHEPVNILDRGRQDPKPIRHRRRNRDPRQADKPHPRRRQHPSNHSLPRRLRYAHSGPPARAQQAQIPDHENQQRHAQLSLKEGRADIVNPHFGAPPVERKGRKPAPKRIAPVRQKIKPRPRGGDRQLRPDSSRGIDPRRQHQRPPNGRRHQRAPRRPRHRHPLPPPAPSRAEAQHRHCRRPQNRRGGMRPERQHQKDRRQPPKINPLRSPFCDCRPRRPCDRRHKKSRPEKFRNRSAVKQVRQRIGRAHHADAGKIGDQPAAKNPVPRRDQRTELDHQQQRHPDSQRHARTPPSREKPEQRIEQITVENRLRDADRTHDVQSRRHVAVLAKIFPVITDHPKVILPVPGKHHLRIEQQQQRRRHRQRVGQAA